MKTTMMEVILDPMTKKLHMTVEQFFVGGGSDVRPLYVQAAGTWQQVKYVWRDGPRYTIVTKEGMSIKRPGHTHLFREVEDVVVPDRPLQPNEAPCVVCQDDATRLQNGYSLCEGHAYMMQHGWTYWELVELEDLAPTPVDERRRRAAETLKWLRQAASIEELETVRVIAGFFTDIRVMKLIDAEIARRQPQNV